MRTLAILLVTALGFGLCACGDVGSETRSVSKSDALGSYSLDKEDLGAKMRAMRMKELPNEGAMSAKARKEAEAEIDDFIEKQITRTSMNLVLKDDDSFVFTVVLGDDTKEASGPFNLDGKKITLTMTHENGKPKDEIREDDTITGTIEGSVVELQLDRDDPTTIKLRK